MAVESLDICIMSPSPARQEWLLSAIAGERGLRVTGSASTFPLLRSLISEAAVDLAVIDPGSRIEPNTLRDWLIELTDLVPVLLFSAEPEPASFNFLVNSKDGGMLSPDSSAEQIVHAIKSIASGLTVFDGALVTRDTVEN